ncbi:MAG TPA: hypothetical protein VIN03_20950 [Roseateles sp.]
MTRIDHRPSAPVLNGNDGAQLQGRMLQEMERQWLDNWGAANAAHSDPAPAEPAQAATASAISTAGVQTAMLNGCTPNGTQAASPHPKPPDRDTSESVRTTRQASQAGHRHAEQGIERPGGGKLADAEDSPTPSRDDLPRAGAGTPFAATALTTTPESASASLPAIAPAGAASTAAAPGLAAAARAPDLPAGDDAGSGSAPAAEPRRLPAVDADLGPHKLTLRELTPDLVQATLRDSQLNHAASQLAAQGLARALMEAGYAQVRVVVNGRHSQGERTDGDETAPLASFTDPTPEPAPKDRIHGH